MADETTQGTITCRLCETAIAVEFRRADANGVQLEVIDSQPLADHYAECQAMEAKALHPAQSNVTVPQVELSGRVNRFLAILEDNGHLTRGTRACTMCGDTQDTCLASLDRRAGRIVRKRVRGRGCCTACDEGNTHPTGSESKGCAEWGAEHGAQS